MQQVIAEKFKIETENLPVFFTDCYDLGKIYDNTREEARKIVKLTEEEKEIYEPRRRIKTCFTCSWRDQKDSMFSVYTKLSKVPFADSLL